MTEVYEISSKKLDKKSEKKKATGYDKYIDWKIFVFPLLILLLIMILPPLDGMKDVGTEYALGEKVVLEHLANQLFQNPLSKIEQWQLSTVQVMEKLIKMGVFDKKGFLDKDAKWCKKQGVTVPEDNLKLANQFVSGLDDKTYSDLLEAASVARKDTLNYNGLNEKQKKTADKGIWDLKIAIGMTIFVVFCFLTNCIPLPTVGLFVGVFLVLTGVVTREQVAAFYWSDATWFIMGSLMFAGAFVKTGVDKRISLFLFSKFARPSVGAITFVLILVITPLTSIMSDHALAAIFLPIVMILFRGSQKECEPLDMELGKMLVITLAMACNIGGFGAPSGGARNVIMLSYLKDMFGIDIGYFTWITYSMPIVLISMPILWLMVQWRFKPKTRDLSQAVNFLKEDIAKMGKWNRSQIITIVIFLVTVFLWMTEEIFFTMGIFPFRLGIGVVAIMGAVAYVLAGVVNWRTYQENVDWGVVWLYAGSIIFGKVLDTSGGAYYIARTFMDVLSNIGFNEGIPLIGMIGIFMGLFTQLMADGPACACVGPVILKMAAIAHPGTSMLPFITLITSCASSFAYCLIIGTPPNAIVYASGILTPKDYFRVGLLMWIISEIILVLMAWLYWVPRGFAGLPSF